MILWELHIINTNSAHLLVPPYPTFTPKRKILKSNQDKTYTGINPPPKKKALFTSICFLPFWHLFIYPGSVRNTVSENIPFCPFGFTSTCSLQWIIGLLQGLWFLAGVSFKGSQLESARGSPRQSSLLRWDFHIKEQIADTENIKLVAYNRHGWEIVSARVSNWAFFPWLSFPWLNFQLSTSFPSQAFLCHEINSSNWCWKFFTF